MGSFSFFCLFNGSFHGDDCDITNSRKKSKILMNKLHKRRLIYIGLLSLFTSTACGLIIYALRQNINLFLTPKQVMTEHIPANYHFRLGGMVKKGSVVHEKEKIGLTFSITDFKDTIIVRYRGILPDLFREGKGVIASGHLSKTGIFIANEVLAKHDENYMPKMRQE